MKKSDCNHQWEEVFDSKAYNDGSYVTTGYICNICGAEKGSSNTNSTNQMKWYEYLIGLPLFIVLIFYLNFLVRR